MPPSIRLASIACACAGVISLLAPASAGATRLGSTPTLPQGAHIASAVAADTPMHVTVTLQPRDPEALQAFATAVSTPGSPQYRDYITPAQFAERFGAAPDAVEAVEASLRAHGLTPGPPSANALSIPVSGTAGTLARAFAVSFAHVSLQNGATAIVNQQAPALDSNVAPNVQAVLGLDTLRPPGRCSSAPTPRPGHSPPSRTSSPAARNPARPRAKPARARAGSPPTRSPRPTDCPGCTPRADRAAQPTRAPARPSRSSSSSPTTRTTSWPTSSATASMRCSRMSWSTAAPAPGRDRGRRRSTSRT